MEKEIRNDWTRRAHAAYNWLKRSIQATGDQGSAHHYSPLFGWAKAYPETSGYLIPTLLRYARFSDQEEAQQIAIDIGQWLTHIQLPGGAFASGTVGSTVPSPFNTAMVIFGLTNLDKKFLTEENSFLIRQSITRSLNWLADTSNPQGVWYKYVYQKGHIPAYYSRAVWTTLAAAQHLKHEKALKKMKRAIEYYRNWIRADGTVANWGLVPGEGAFTHTIAYTLEGFLECAHLLQDDDLLMQVVQSAEVLMEKFRSKGKLAGQYSRGWKGNYRFQCLTGNAQLSVFYHRLWQLSGRKEFQQTAATILASTLPYQRTGKKENTHGAIPGSIPFWGPYMRFRYPNWSTKFLLDALIVQLQPEKE